MMSMALSNQSSDCRVLNVDPANPERGPFMATQTVVSLDDPGQEENLCLLQQDGVWIERTWLGLTPESEPRALARGGGSVR
jgi:hypothetical protein